MKTLTPQQIRDLDDNTLLIIKQELALRETQNHENKVNKLARKFKGKCIFFDCHIYEEYIFVSEITDEPLRTIKGVSYIFAYDSKNNVEMFKINENYENLVCNHQEYRVCSDEQFHAVLNKYIRKVRKLSKRQ